MFDCILSQGTVIDGRKTPRFIADVGLRGDRIAAIGDLSAAESARRIDVRGRVVAPGFIDVHNHSDGWLLNTPHLRAKTTQGFTTEILMSDGISYAPVDERTWREWLFYLRALNGLHLDEYEGWTTLDDYMQRLDRRNVQNAAFQVPYANVRALACGFGRAAVDDFQMRSIQAEIRHGMEAGGVGVSTGLDYIVQCFSTTDEIAEACRAMRPYDGLYVSHVRYKKGLLPALAELVEIGRRAEVRVHISHLKVVTTTLEPLLAFLDEARRTVDLSFDTYPYQRGSTMLSYFLPYECFEAGPLAVLERLRRPELRARFAAGLRQHRIDVDHIRLAWVASKHNARHQGKTLGAYIRERGRPAEEALADLLIEEALAVLCVMDEGDDTAIRPLLQHDLMMMGTDGIFAPGGVVHPRMFGSTGRFLGPCVRDERLFSLEVAVHKLTAKPAERFRLTDRGELREGAFADLVVFDPVTIDERATYAEPQQYTVGVEHVFVNGVAVIAAGQDVDLPPDGHLPGRRLFARN